MYILTHLHIGTSVSVGWKTWRGGEMITWIIPLSQILGEINPLSTPPPHSRICAFGCKFSLYKLLNCYCSGKYCTLFSELEKASDGTPIGIFAFYFKIESSSYQGTLTVLDSTMAL